MFKSWYLQGILKSTQITGNDICRSLGIYLAEPRTLQLISHSDFFSTFIIEEDIEKFGNCSFPKRKVGFIYNNKKDYMKVKVNAKNQIEIK